MWYEIIAFEPANRTPHVTRHTSHATRHTSRHLQYLAEEAAALGLQFNTSEWSSEVIKAPQQRNWYAPCALPPLSLRLCTVHTAENMVT